MAKYSVLLLVIVIMHLIFASTIIINSHARPLSSISTQEDEDDRELEHKLGLMEISGRDEMVRMAGYGEEKVSTVLISGVVVCRNACVEASHGHPVSGVLLGATCKTNKNTEKLTQIINGGKAVTDRFGEFTIDVPSELHAIKNFEKSCSVKVLKLPQNSPCGQSDIITSKEQQHKELEPIRLPSSADDGVRIYAAGTITLQDTFRSLRCETKS